MREYGRVAPTFWTRGSGKKLRGKPDAQVVALYLFTCPASTMIGIYHVALPTLAHETGLTVEEAERALGEVCALDVARYDPEEELVYLPEGARYQIGERLKPTDKRVAGIKSALAQFSRHPFALDFARRYAADFCLEAPASDASASPPPSPSEAAASPPASEAEAPCKPLARDSDAGPMPLASQARQGKDQATQEKSPPPAGARVCEDNAQDHVQPPTFAPAAPPPSGAAIATDDTLLAAVARHPMLVTLHSDRRWAQNASSGFMSAAVRAGDVEAAVEAFVTGEAAKAPGHSEALATWVRDNIGRYLKKAKQHGDDARARQRRTTGDRPAPGGAEAKPRLYVPGVSGAALPMPPGIEGYGRGGRRS